jgi:hypothetical protein
MSNNDDDISPGRLSDLDDEHEYIKNRGSFSKRVKIEKFHTWTVRWLPAELGPNKRWAARIARHWINGRPFICKQETSPDFGGDPAFECPLCKTAILLSKKSKNADAIQRARRSMAVPQWLTYCLVFEQEDGNGDSTVIRPPERWKPWEFWLYQTPFDLLRAMVKKGKRDERPLSIFDFKKGNNIFVTANRKGITLDKDDPRAISKYEDKVDELVKKIMSGISLPNDFQPLSDSKLDEALGKLEYYIIGRKNRDDDEEDFGGGGKRRSGGDDEEDDKPRRHRSDDSGDEEDQPRRRREVDDGEEDQPRRRREVDDGEEERPARRQSVSDEEEEAPTRRRQSGGEDERPAKPNREVDDGEDPPRRSRDDEDEEDEIPMGDEDEDGKDERPPARDRLPPPPAARKVQSPPPASAPSQSSVDEDEEVPEERHDPAPPAKEKPTREEIDDKPPPVSAAGAPKLSDRIRRNISNMNNRE